MTRLDISPPNPTIALGATQSFQVTAELSNGKFKTLHGGVTWESSDPGVATVSPQGVATGRAVGKTTIRVTDDSSGATTTTDLQITSPVLTEIQLTPKNPKIARGTTVQFVATGIFTDGSNYPLSGNVVTWTVQPSTIATIDASGVATGIAAGSATVRVQHQNGVWAEQTLTVSSSALASIDVTPSNPSMPLGTSVTFVATGHYQDNTTQDITSLVTWSSDANGVVQFTAGSPGTATATAVGQTLVTATLGGKSGTSNVSVSVAALVEINVTPALATVPAGLTVALSAHGRYTDNSVREITTSVSWMSDQPSIAFVSNAAGSAGVVTGMVKGTAHVTARDVDSNVSKSVPIDVTSALLSELSIAPLAETRPVGVPIRYTVSGLYTDGSRRDVSSEVTWSTTGAAADVSNAPGTEGQVIGRSVGTVTVIAKDALSQKTVSTTLDVTPAALLQIQVEPALAHVPLGYSVRFDATGIYTDSTHVNITKLVKWLSTDASVATISNAAGSEGLVTPHAVGAIDIIASDQSQQISGHARLEISPAVLLHLDVGLSGAAEIPIGESLSATATATYSDGTTADLTHSATWISKNTAVIAVEQPSTLRAVGAGTAEIEVIDATSGARTSFFVTGTAAILKRIDLRAQGAGPAPVGILANVIKGESLHIDADGLYSDGSVRNITKEVWWTSEAPGVLEVSNEVGSAGVAHGANPGDARIVASLSNQQAAAWIRVLPAELRRLTLLPSAPTVGIGKTTALHAIGEFSDGLTSDVTSRVTWTTSPMNYADVSNVAGSNGVVTGLRAGSTNVVVIDPASQTTASVPLTVTAEALTALEIRPNPVTIPRGLSHQLTAIGTYADGATAELTASVVWSSADLSLATISSAGLVTVPTSNSGQDTTVTATVPGVDGASPISATALVHSSQAVPVDFAVWGAASSITVGETLFLKGTVTMSDGTSTDVTESTRCSATGSLVPSTTRAAVYAVTTGAGSFSCSSTLHPQLGAETFDVVAVERVRGRADIERDFSGVVNPSAAWSYGSVATDGNFSVASTSTANGWATNDGSVSIYQLPAVTTCPEGWASNGGVCTLVATHAGTMGVVETVPNAGAGGLAGRTALYPVGIDGQTYTSGSPAPPWTVPIVPGARTARVCVDAGWVDGGIWDDDVHAFDVLCGGRTMEVRRQEITGHNYPHHKTWCWDDLPVGAICTVGNLGAPWTPPFQGWGKVSVAFTTQFFSGAPAPPPNAVILHSSGSAAPRASARWSAPRSGAYLVDATFSATESSTYECGQWVYECTPYCHGCFIGQCWCGDNYPDFCGWLYQPRTCQSQTTSDVDISTNTRTLFSSKLSLSAGTSTTYKHVVYLNRGDSLQFGATHDGVADQRTRVQATVTPVPSISARGDATCTVRPDGTLWCWGSNDFGVVGDGTTITRWSPSQVGSDTSWTSVSVGPYANSACAIREDGSLWCWGNNDYGQLGTGNHLSTLTPARVGGPARIWVDIAVGQLFACGITSDSSLYCWGLLPASSRQVNTPELVDTGFESLSAAWHVCGIRNDRSLWCWGNNNLGALGVGTTDPSAYPLPVSPGSQWSTVTAGTRGTCAVDAAGQSWCWGIIPDGQPWYAQHATLLPTAVNVGAAIQLALGDFSACALETGGALSCWGYNAAGILGNGSAIDSSVPVPVPGEWARASVGSRHACAIDAQERVWCWGNNELGQVGDGTLVNSSTPVLVEVANVAPRSLPLSLSLSATQTTATLSWKTNVRTTTSLSWGPAGTLVFVIPDDGVYSLNHSVTLTGLQPGSVYSFRLGGHDQRGTSLSTTTRSFPTQD